MSFTSLFTSAANIARIQGLRPDLATAGIDTAQEILDWYLNFGKSELISSDPIVGIDESFLLNLRPDVAAAVSAGQFASATQWYLNNGANDGFAANLAPSAEFNSTAYAAANADLAAAGIDTAAELLNHFIRFGAIEGRAADGSGSTGGTTGTTYTLETTTDVLTGTANNDTFVALQTGDATETFSAADIIDGAAGTDTLTLINTEAGAANSATVSNIETLSYRATNGGNIDMDDFPGVTTLLLDRTTGASDVSNVGIGTTTTFSASRATMNTTFTYKAADVTGTADAGTVVFNGVIDGAELDFAGAVETMNVSTTGSASQFDNLVFNAATTALNITADEALTVDDVFTAAGLTTLTVTGDSLVTITPTLNTTVATVNASGNTGGTKVTAGNVAEASTGTVDFTFTGGTGADDVDVDATDNADEISIDVGAGDDRVTLGNVALDSGDTVAGGEGTDTVEMSNEAALTSTTAGRMSGFETLAIFDDNDAGAETFDVSLLSGITAVTIGAISAGDAITLDNLNATQAGAITVTGTNAVDLTLNVTNASDVGTNDTINITVDDGLAATNTITLADLSTASVENVNVTATDNVTFTAATGMTGLSNVTFTGAGNVSYTTGALALGSNVSIDGSALTGTFTVDTSSATGNGSAITGGSAADSITMNNGLADIASGGASADTFVFDIEASDRMTGGDGADIFTMDNDTDTANVAAAAVITDMSTDDNLDLDLSTIEAIQIDGATANNMVDVGGNNSAAGDLTFTTVSSDNTTLSGTDDIVVLTGKTYADSAAALADIQGAGARTFDIGAAFADNESILIAYELTAGGVQIAGVQQAGGASTNSDTLDHIDVFVTLQGLTATSVQTMDIDLVA